MTRQGVRDLDAKFGRIKKKPEQDVPREALVCAHPRAKIRRETNGDEYCSACGQTWDWNGDPY